MAPDPVDAGVAAITAQLTGDHRAVMELVAASPVDVAIGASAMAAALVREWATAVGVDPVAYWSTGLIANAAREGG